MTKNKKIGFGIIVYDKFDEVKIASDIIKSFDKRFFVLACTNHPDGLKELEYENIDEIIVSENIPFEKNKWAENRENINLVMRVTSNIQRCNQELLKKDFDYCVFLHSDSWMLTKNGIMNIINQLEKENKMFAVTGVGLGMMTGSSPLGNILDMLWIYNCKEVEKRRLFEFDVVEMFPHKLDSHGIIAAQLITKIGMGNILYYADTGNSYFWKNEYLTEKNNDYKFTTNATPALYLPPHEFIHVHVGAFPGNLGEELQGYYLRRYNLKKGKTTTSFLKKCKLSDKQVFDEIKRTDKQIKRKLLFSGLTYQTLGWGKNYVKINNFLKKNIFRRIPTIIRAWASTIFIKIIGRAKYYGYFYGAIIDQSLCAYYSKNIYEKHILEKYGHSKWYDDKRLK